MNVLACSLSLTGDFLQTDKCECMRTCLLLGMLWCVDSALCARYVSAERLHPGWRTPLCLSPTSRRNGALGTAHLCILRARCLGEPAAQLRPVQRRLGCLRSWSASLDHKISIYIYIYILVLVEERGVCLYLRELASNKFLSTWTWRPGIIFLFIKHCSCTESLLVGSCCII